MPVVVVGSLDFGLGPTIVAEEEILWIGVCGFGSSWSGPCCVRLQGLPSSRRAIVSEWAPLLVLVGRRLSGTARTRGSRTVLLTPSELDQASLVRPRPDVSFRVSAGEEGSVSESSRGVGTGGEGERVSRGAQSLKSSLPPNPSLFSGRPFWREPKGMGPPKRRATMVTWVTRTSRTRLRLPPGLIPSSDMSTAFPCATAHTPPASVSGRGVGGSSPCAPPAGGLGEVATPTRSETDRRKGPSVLTGPSWRWLESPPPCVRDRSQRDGRRPGLLCILPPRALRGAPPRPFPALRPGEEGGGAVKTRGRRRPRGAAAGAAGRRGGPSSGVGDATPREPQSVGRRARREASARSRRAWWTRRPRTHGRGQGLTGRTHPRRAPRRPAPCPDRTLRPVTGYPPLRRSCLSI